MRNRRRQVVAAVAATLGVIVSSAAPASSATIVTGSRLTVSGTQLQFPAGTPIILRGFNWNKDAAVPGAGNPPSGVNDATDNAAEGANMVRLGLDYYDYGSCTGAGGGPTPGSDAGDDAYDPGASGNLNSTALAYLDAMVNAATAAHLWVDLQLHGGTCDFYSNPQVQGYWAATWTFLAQRYAGFNYIGMYEPMTEPSPPNGSHQDPNPLTATAYENAYDAIRTTAGDTTTPIMIGAAPNYDIRGLQDLWNQGLGNPAYVKLIATANFYELGGGATEGPTGGYVKQAQVDPTCAQCTGYPGNYTDVKGGNLPGNPGLTCTYPGEGTQVYMNKSWLGKLFTYCLTTFRDANNVPVFVDQVGIRTITPNSLAWENDQLATFSANNVGFAHWVYRLPYTSNNIPGGGDISVMWQDNVGNWYVNGSNTNFGGAGIIPSTTYGDWLAMLMRHFKD